MAAHTNHILLATAIILAFTLIRIPFTLQSVKESANKRDKIKSIIYSILSIIMVLGALYFLYSSVSPIKISFYFRALGLIFGVFGNILLLWTHIALGKNFVMYVTSTNNHKLVQSGPYSFVRHPMYTSFLMIALGLFLISALPPFGLFAASIVLPIIYRIKIEETYLKEVFGKEYINYMQKTNRLIPYLY